MRDLTGYRNDAATGSTGPAYAHSRQYIGEVRNFSGSYSDYAGGPWDRLIRKGKLQTVGPYKSNLAMNHGSYYPNGWPAGSVTSRHDNPYTPGLTGQWTDGWEYGSGSYKALIPAGGLRGPQTPYYINENALQLNASLNLFGKAIIKKTTTRADESKLTTQVADADTNAAKSRWTIQTKFETPMLNFNSYNNLSESCTTTPVGGEQVPGECGTNMA